MKNSIVFTFGRFNPVTTGHEKLVTRVLETARSLDADHIVYLSFTQNNKTDPLNWSFKRRVCENAFRGVNISDNTDIRNPYIALEYLKDRYKKIVMVAGSDQAGEYTKRFTGYTLEWGIDFSVISAGERLTESAGVDGMSATKMRQYALDNDKKSFYAGLPSSLSENVKSLVFSNTRKSLKKT